MSNSTTTVVEITENARDQIIALRESEGIPDLHLGLRITGVGPQGFVYETSFLRSEDIASSDIVEDHGGLPVAISLDSIENLRGAVLDLSGDGGGPGLVMRNPNVPSPTLGGTDLGDLELTGTPEEKVRTLLDERINPAIASHGGVANLIRVDDDVAHLELGGGCQGCGLAAVDHSMGTNPFYA